MEERKEHQRRRRRLKPQNNVGSPATTTMHRTNTETTPFHINDHADLLLEVLKRLDARSLSVAARVCRLWSGLARNDVVWEHLCFRHAEPQPPRSLAAVRSLVGSLGGYRRLYTLCVEPALSSLRLRLSRVDSELTRRVWTRHGAQLTLSLFCVDYYERVAPAGAGIRSDASSSSLMFLCNPVNV